TPGDALFEFGVEGFQRLLGQQLGRLDLDVVEFGFGKVGQVAQRLAFARVERPRYLVDHAQCSDGLPVAKDRLAGVETDVGLARRVSRSKRSSTGVSRTASASSAARRVVSFVESGNDKAAPDRKDDGGKSAGDKTGSQPGVGARSRSSYH